jgi:hypothetical protein
MDCPLIAHGVLIDWPWNSLSHGSILYSFTLVLYGLPMDYPWIAYGLLMD